MHDHPITMMTAIVPKPHGMLRFAEVLMEQPEEDATAVVEHMGSVHDREALSGRKLEAP